MPQCKRCGKTFSYLENDYCEPCEEFLTQLAREKDTYICLHCNQTFSSEKALDRHRWNCYYRLGHLPKVKKI